MNATSKFSYDAMSILGFGKASTEPLPEPLPGEVVIRVGDWSLQDLQDCAVGKELMHQRSLYAGGDCEKVKLIPGVYRVRLSVPDSNRKNFSEQKGLFVSGEDVAPVALGVATLLVHLKETDNDLLENYWCRCAEALPDGSRAGFYVHEGRVRVLRCWDGFRCDYLYLSAARKA